MLLLGLNMDLLVLVKNKKHKNVLLEVLNVKIYKTYMKKEKYMLICIYQERIMKNFAKTNKLNNLII